MNTPTDEVCADCRSPETTVNRLFVILTHVMDRGENKGAMQKRLCLSCVIAQGLFCLDHHLVKTTVMQQRGDGVTFHAVCPSCVQAQVERMGLAACRRLVEPARRVCGSARLEAEMFPVRWGGLNHLPFETQMVIKLVLLHKLGVMPPPEEAIFNIIAAERPHVYIQ